MGKRKNKDKEYIKKKIRKLERRLEKIPNDEESKESSPPSSPPPRSPTPPTPPSPVTRPRESPSTETNHQNSNNVDHNQATEDDLPEELLQALGTEGEEETEVGEAIRPELALRWMRIMQTGLGKEPREAILKKYPTPVNFPRAIAPVLNAEISATLSELSLKRDKRVCYRQNLTGKLMACLGKSLTKILTGNINTKTLVEEINDAAKIAAEIHHQDSSSRNFFALAGANKTVQIAVKTSSPDELLFGADCAEKIRAAQAIQKTGSLIKSNEKKPTRSGALTKNLGNWRSPSQYQQTQRARGGQHHQQQYQRQRRPDQARQKHQKPAPRIPRSRHHR